MGVGSNPTTWFVAVAFLALVRTLIDLGKEIRMETFKKCRKARVKLGLTLVGFAVSETFWAIATNVVAGFVTPSIHQKGAPLSG
jgi:hypothetical protein